MIFTEWTILTFWLSRVTEMRISELPRATKVQALFSIGYPQTEFFLFLQVKAMLAQLVQSACLTGMRSHADTIEECKTE